MARSSDSDDYHRSSRRKRYKSSSSTSSSSSSRSSNGSRERRRRKRSRSNSRRRRGSRERARRSRSRSRRRSGSRDRRDRSGRKGLKGRRRTPSRRWRSRSSSNSNDSRKRDLKKRDDRRDHIDTDSRACSVTKDSSRDAFVIELPNTKNEAERVRAIEGVNSAGFSQQSFVSKRGQSTKSDESVGSGGDAHMSAMFGTTSLEEFLATQAKKPIKVTDYKDTPELLMHENLFDEPERRLEKWRKKLQNERRKRLVAQNVPSVT